MLDQGRLVRNSKYDLVCKEPGFVNLYFFVVKYLEEMEAKRQSESSNRKAQDKRVENSGYNSGRMLSYFK